MDPRPAISRSLGEARVSLVLIKLRRALEPSPSAGRLVVRARDADHPLTCRLRSSDLLTFEQVFLKRQYAQLADRSEPRFIVDAGANIGCASAFLLSRFPNAELLAVEPDPQSFELLCENLEPYGSRATARHAGVWSHTAELVMEEDRYRDGREWSHQVRPASPGEDAGIAGVDLARLMADAGHESVSLLKMDIEGAEAVVFSEGYADWIDRVETIAVELHDDSHFGSGSKAFAQAIDGHGFDVRRAGELTVAVRKREQPAA
jgi:FkbM family methyltransferase